MESCIITGKNEEGLYVTSHHDFVKRQDKAEEWASGKRCNTCGELKKGDGYGR
jgi:hypothetical protein